MSHQRGLSDIGISIIPALNLSGASLMGSSLIEESEELSGESQYRQYFHSHDYLDEKIANIDSLLSSIESRLKETKKRHVRGQSTQLNSKVQTDIITRKGFLGHMLMIKNIELFKEMHN